MSAATAPVKLATHSAAVTPLKHNVNHSVHVVKILLMAATASSLFLRVRPDFHFWDGRIVDVTGPITRPSILDIWPESTKDLADIVTADRTDGIVRNKAST